MSPKPSKNGSKGRTARSPKTITEPGADWRDHSETVAAERFMCQGKLVRSRYERDFIVAFKPFERLYPYQYQHQAVKSRKGAWYKFDFAWPDIKLDVEIQGGVWVRGQHGRGSGIIAGYDRANDLTLAGWRFLYLTDRDLRPGTIEDTLDMIVGFIRRERAAFKRET